MNNQSESVKPLIVLALDILNLVSWRLPILFQCIFAIFSGVCMFFMPDTPRWYYARNREAEGDAVLTRLNNSTIDDPAVQKTKQEILVAIEAELEATTSLRWQKFLTMGLTDKTPMRIVLRLCICFWIPMLQEWMGCSLLAYFCKQPYFRYRMPSRNHIYSLFS